MSFKAYLPRKSGTMRRKKKRKGRGGGDNGMPQLSNLFHPCVIVSLSVLHSACNDQEWTCLDGMCIPMQSRCNNVPDCSDRSDEENCPGGVLIYLSILYLFFFLQDW